MTSDETSKDATDLPRRSLLKKTAAGTLGLVGLKALGAEARADEAHRLPEISPPDPARPAPRPGVRESVKITKLETFLVKPRWLFLKVHTDAGIVGPRRADHRRPRADLRRPRSRRSSPTWSARTRARSCITGRRSTATPSIAAGRSSPAPSAASTRRSGTSRARRSACPSTSCSAARRAQRIRVYAHARHAGADHASARRRASPRSRPGPAR